MDAPLSDAYEHMMNLVPSVRQDHENLFCVTEFDKNKGVRTTYVTPEGVVEEYRT